MYLFISGAEIVFIFFIVLLIFGADKIPSIAKSLAKGVNQVRSATNEIKTAINPIDKEIRAPNSIRLKRSRPNLSVPNINFCSLMYSCSMAGCDKWAGKTF